ncbi:MAG: DUF4388 domain-containing protein [candidate division Zixibacteria bacterium]|nr:DUF4388 domain-containing protein [candidate division Zixibacteria bacterium]
MSSCNLRLDQILVREGLVSEDQIKEALMRQKAHGGKVGSQLLYHRYIDEAALVKALTLQFECRGVLLSDIEINSEVLKFIPKRVVIARKVIPFDYDPQRNVLKVACEEPNDEGLVGELNFVASGKEIELYIAAELALNTAIARFYLGRDVSLDDNLLLEIPDAATDTGEIPDATDAVREEMSAGSRGDVLLVTDEEYSAQMLKSIIERSNYRIIITDSADDAIDRLSEGRFHTVLIKDTVPGDYIDLIDRLRKYSPQTIVRYYESAAGLILRGDPMTEQEDMAVRSLELLTSLLSIGNRSALNHGAAVGQYANRLCQQLGLPIKERLQVTTAAYLHDLAKYYHSPASSDDPRSVIDLTVKLLESVNYPPVVVEMLRSMYVDLGGKYTKRLPIEILGGNILTIVDLFCENVAVDERLSLDKFDAIKKKFRDLTGKLFLGEVVDALVTMIQEQILTQQTLDTSSQVMIISSEAGRSYPLELRLKREGFHVLSASSLDSSGSMFQRRQPDILVLAIPGTQDKVTSHIESLSEYGINVEDVPTFVLADDDVTPHLTNLLEQGIEDVLAIDVGPDLLVAKMQKIHASLEDRRRKVETLPSQTTGTIGRLADMNLVDLLQALGPSRKTAKVSVSPNIAEEGELTIYLNNGVICYARYLDKLGAEAIYEAIGWTDGTWVVGPVSHRNLPEPNNTLSTESILLEGCRLMDEKAKSGQLL